MSGPPQRALRLTPEGRLDAPAMLAAPPLGRLLALLNQDGEEARVVGGAVRDSLLGRAVTDLDIATTATPPAVLKRAQAASLRAIPTGIAHGTVTVLVGDTSFEVTTLRRDVETDGRHAKVAFSRDFATDAERRDFTVNALSVGPDGTIFDTVGGIPDLTAGRVRFIGNADRRIREDHLRILRFFRFHAAYGVGDLDPEGLAAVILHRDTLASLSRERIRAELFKVLAAAGVVPVAEVMNDTAILPTILGGPADVATLARLIGIEAALSTPPDPLLRLAALGVRESADAERLRERLRLSNDEARRLADAAQARTRLDPARPPDRQGCLALLYACGERAARDGALLAASDAGADAGWPRALATLARESVPQLPIGGTDVLARGISGGRRVGAVLKRLQADWIRAGFSQDPQTLRRLLDAAVAAEPPAAD